MLPTPSTSHVSYDIIYEPAEDSYLFLDTLSSASETAWLRSRFNPDPISTQRPTTSTPTPTPTPLIVELGPGSGVIIAFLTAHARTIFGRDILSLSADVNPYACRATRTTVEKALHETRAERQKEETQTAIPTTSNSESNDSHSLNTNTHTDQSPSSIYLASLNGDLATPLRPGQVDVLLFNPPYVPTDSVPELEVRRNQTSPQAGMNGTSQASSSHASTALTFEESSHLLALSYAGGVDGMQVTARVLEDIPRILSPRGVAYILFCRGNNPEEVKRWIRGRADHDGGGKWSAETVGTSGKTAGWEKLEIVRIWRDSKTSSLDGSDTRIYQQR